MNTRRTLCFAAALVALAPTSAHAGGFSIYDLSAEALAKGGAVSASTERPDAAFFNPAALAFVPGGGVAVGGLAVRLASRFEPRGGGPDSESVRSLEFLPTLYGHARVSDRVALGLGVFTLFGLATEWPEDWVGRDDSIKASIQTVTFNPTVAFRFNDLFSLAAGVQVVRGAVELVAGIPAPIGGRSQIGAGGWGVGGNAALLARLIPDRFHAAFTYRSRVKVDLDGRVDFDPAAPEFARSLPDQKGSSGVTLPDLFTLGLMWRPVPSVALTFDPQLVLWSTYDEILIDFETATDQRLRRDYDNSFNLRFGIDWSTPVQGLSVRGGFIFDENPAKAETLSPSLPDADRLDFGAGLGYAIGRFRADVGYLFVYALDTEARGGEESPEGTYHSTAHLWGLTLSAAFGR